MSNMNSLLFAAADTTLAPVMHQSPETALIANSRAPNTSSRTEPAWVHSAGAAGAAAAPKGTALKPVGSQASAVVLYPNQGRDADAHLCQHYSGPCGYRQDPATFPGVMLLNGKTRLQPNTVYMFTYGQDGRIHIIDADANPAGLKHSHLSAGGTDARAAGHIETDAQGHIRTVSNTSGHFKPGPTPLINRDDCSLQPRPHENSVDVTLEYLRRTGCRVRPDVTQEIVEEKDSYFQDALRACQRVVRERHDRMQKQARQKNRDF